jgi:hypothetical protein
MPAAALLARVRDLGKEIEEVLAPWQQEQAMMSSAGGRPSWQAMVSVRNFHRSARAPPAARGHARASPAVTAPQVTASVHDFAGSLGVDGRLATVGPHAPHNGSTLELCST